MERFEGINRLYGDHAISVLANAHICIVGLGGVGSWAVESLARSGIGKLTLIDYDIIAESNINRQLPALDSTLGEKKSSVLRQRVLDINPACECNIIDDFINTENLWDYFYSKQKKGNDLSMKYDFVIDAIDSIKFKAALIYFCRRNKIPVITTGGAGGVTDPATIKVKDLSRTVNDALAARVRSQLRTEYGFSKNTKRYFGVECIYSDQQKVYPDKKGNVSTNKPGIHGVHLDCRFGYGAASYVTASFAFLAVSRVINRLLRQTDKSS